jgi:taurine dioxygenase
MAEIAAISPEDHPYTRITVKPIAGALGAEIEGVDIASGVDQETQDEIYRAWLENNLIFFRNQSISPAQQIAFARRFGEIHLHLFNKAMDDYPEITELLKTPDMKSNAGGRWHSDQMYTPEPAKATMLYGREIPEGRGDTMFSNMYLAYETLSEGMKASLQDLRAIHNGDSRNHPSGKTRMERVQEGTIHMPQLNPGDAQTISTHPVVRTHPETGRKLLYIGGHTEKFEGWTEEESAPLLDYLKTHATRPEFTCRFHWTENAMAFWDNRCCQHFAINDYNGYQRRMHKIMIKGDAPF